MIMENLGEILMTAGFLLVVMAVFISMRKAQAAEGDAPDFPDWA